VRAWLLAALGFLSSIGCSSSQSTAVLVEVLNRSPTPPAGVTVSVFDRFGLLGRSHVAPATLPGSITVRGLPDTVQPLRVAAVGDAPRALGGVAFQTQPHAQLTELLTLDLATADSDGDGVPDPFDDCPTVADPDQANSAGGGPGDACRGDGGIVPPGSDLAAPPGSDLATRPGADLATPPGADLAGIPLFTDGFETGVIGTFWSEVLHNGTLTVDTVHAHRGQYALHVHNGAIVPPDYAQADVVETQAVPLPDLYVRAFVWVQSAPSGFDPTSVAIFAADQAASPFKGVNLNLAGGSFSSFNNVPTPNVSFTASTPAMPTDQWVCLEWHVQAATSGSAKAFVNGAEVTALSGTQNTLPSPTLGEVGIGLIAFPSVNTKARDVWYDDIAVDANPIGCVK
jgi:hypothetical protein